MNCGTEARRGGAGAAQRACKSSNSLRQLVCVIWAQSRWPSMVAGLKPPVVYDNVFNARALGLCHDAAVAGGLGHACFAADAPRAPIEHALSSFLSELGDAEYGHVEYWARQEWKHIEAHAVDEKVAAAAARCASRRRATCSICASVRRCAGRRACGRNALARGGDDGARGGGPHPPIRRRGDARGAAAHDLWFLPLSGGAAAAASSSARSCCSTRGRPTRRPRASSRAARGARRRFGAPLQRARRVARGARSRVADDGAPIRGSVAARRRRAPRAGGAHRHAGIAPAVLDALAETERVTTVPFRVQRDDARQCGCA